jgi:hypothetical protein
MNLGYQKKMIYLLQREEQLEFHTYIKERIGFILRMERFRLKFIFEIFVLLVSVL